MPIGFQQFDEDKNDWIYYLALVTQLGLVVVITILVGFFAGLFVDSKLNTSPIFTIVLLVFGILGGFYNAYLMITRKMK